jgi:hypothetical protein
VLWNGAVIKVREGAGRVLVLHRRRPLLLRGQPRHGDARAGSQEHPGRGAGQGPPPRAPQAGGAQVVHGP